MAFDCLKVNELSTSGGSGDMCVLQPLKHAAWWCRKWKVNATGLTVCTLVFGNFVLLWINFRQKVVVGNTIPSKGTFNLEKKILTTTQRWEMSVPRNLKQAFFWKEFCKTIRVLTLQFVKLEIHKWMIVYRLRRWKKKHQKLWPKKFLRAYVYILNVSLSRSRLWL